ncbi:MAG: hypothetical protein MI824_14690 [Hyphomicrobiales bacterium]|nr:hypothetical protein [Hyphomicrobiales bacterium]
MQIKPTFGDWRAAQDVHKRFSRKIGSAHIATQFALRHLSSVLRTTEIRSVLEFGAGIGNISYFLLRNLPGNVKIECTEHSDFCRAQLLHNIPSEFYERLIIHETKTPTLKKQFDLVIVDGSLSRDAHFLGDGSICFVEGSRNVARDMIQHSLAERGLICDFVNYTPRRRIVWRMTRFHIPRPALKAVKGCWIGRVTAIPCSNASSRARKGATPSARTDLHRTHAGSVARQLVLANAMVELGGSVSSPIMPISD